MGNQKHTHLCNLPELFTKGKNKQIGGKLMGNTLTKKLNPIAFFLHKPISPQSIKCFSKDLYNEKTIFK
jgi:hypothetical protein